MSESFLEAKRGIERSIKEGTPVPSPHPTTLQRTNIKELPELFQHRSPLEHASETHIKELARTLDRGSPLEPVTVFWTGKQWACLDGHHRLAAYRKSKWRKAVPVMVFEGTADQALLRAAQANTRDKLPMSRVEKLNAAWRLTVGTRLSKAAIVKGTNVSDGTVGHMRRTMHALLHKTPRRDLSDTTWGQAQRYAKGNEAVDGRDWDAEREEEAKRLAGKIIKAIGQRGTKDVEAFALALEIIDQRLPLALAKHWQECLDDFGQAEEDAEF